MSTLKPWAYGPFELIVHAEMHRRAGADFDRRIALISFDNAIEVAITTYLSLHPIQRGNRQYQKIDIEKWLDNYHTKVDFFLDEASKRGINIVCPKDEIVWFHDVRNGQYHGGSATIPQELELQGIRKVACWVFSTLFDIPDIDRIIESYIAEKTNSNLPQRIEKYDRLIDAEYDVIQVGDQLYYASEVLFLVDPVNYSEVGKELLQRITVGGKGRAKTDA